MSLVLEGGEVVAGREATAIVTDCEVEPAACRQEILAFVTTYLSAGLLQSVAGNGSGIWFPKQDGADKMT